MEAGMYVMMRLSVVIIIWSYFRHSTVMTALPPPCQNRPIVLLSIKVKTPSSLSFMCAENTNIHACTHNV